MKIHRLFIACALVAGCSSTPATDIGDATMANGQVFHISREGDMPAAGVSTQLVVKPASGAKPDSVMGWVGVADAPASAKVAATYDPNDGDFDDDITCPNPLPEGSKIYFDITEGSTTDTISVDIK
jgi:hypothetical protein